MATLKNPINRLLWRPPTLWWAIKAYLHSFPLKGSEAPERSCVWSDISVPLHSLPCCHDLSYTIKKQEHGQKASTTTLSMSQIYVNYHCYICQISEHTILWLFITTVSVHNRTALCVIEYSSKCRSNKKTVILTCWISWDHVSISQLLPGAHLRSSEKNKGWGKKIIQRGAHSRLKKDRGIKFNSVLLCPNLH